MTQQYNTLVVLGPTASGKTQLAVRLAHALKGEIVSADSRQVYRGLDIGSGKDLNEYQVKGKRVKYHLIDIVGLDREFNVFEYQKRAYKAIESLWSRKKLPVIVGGTGLYLEAVLKGYHMTDVPENPKLRKKLSTLTDEALRERLLELKPKQHNTSDVNDRDRLIRAIEIADHDRVHVPKPGPDIKPLILGTRWPRPVLRKRINKRLHERMNNGLIEEVEGLIKQGVSPERLHFLGLEYRYIVDFLQGDIKNQNDMCQKLASAICQFAKRQETWFRRMERNGAQIHWVDRADLTTAGRILIQQGLIFA